MMSNQYLVLFSLEINHTYYKDGICKQLQFTPSFSTRDLMARYQLLLQKTHTGFSFLTSRDIAIEDFLTAVQMEEEVVSFSFDVTSADSNFAMITDYPISEKGRFMFHIAIMENTTTLERTFIRSDDFIDFSVTIDFDAIIRFRESGNNPIHTISFEARKTQWRYYVINNSEYPFKKIEVKSNTNISFEDPIDVILQNGQKAHMFSSGSLLLPLKEKSEYVFDLLDVDTTSNSAPKTILTKLPTPAVNATERYTENGVEKIASPIYIYV